MARRSHSGFLAVLVPLALMSFMIYNDSIFNRAGKNIYNYFHPDTKTRDANSIYGGDSEAIPVIKKLLTKAEVHVTVDSTEDVILTGGDRDDRGYTNGNGGVTYEENRVLFKYQKATQDPSFECVIRIIKYRRPKAEEVFTAHDKWIRSKCDNIPCSVEAKYSLSLADFFDADVVVLMPGRLENYQWDELVKARPRGQLWALYTKESPVHEPQLSPPPEILKGNPYNLSMTFRSGSDIDLSYGHFIPGPASGKKLGPKSKLMMWMASRCEPLGWERTKFVTELQKYFPVDVYGKCGTFECPKHDWDSCLGALKQYKFYLALENSECAEYITEKFWSNAYAAGMVPIAYGAFKEDYVRAAPPNSFIHLNDFSSMEQFVDYINLLDKNDTMYRSYFEWRKHGRISQGAGFRTALSAKNLCSLTKKLVEISLYPEQSWRGRNPDFSAWWAPTCRHQTELLGVKI